MVRTNYTFNMYLRLFFCHPICNPNCHLLSAIWLAGARLYRESPVMPLCSGVHSSSTGGVRRLAERSL
jgi:hypothetical protein